MVSVTLLLSLLTAAFVTGGITKAVTFIQRPGEPILKLMFKKKMKSSYLNYVERKMCNILILGCNH